MPMIDVCYVKSRSGSTTTAVGLAVVLPASARAVVVECDPAGCGRLDLASPTWPRLGMADAVVVLTRGRVEELGHLREHVGELVRQVTGRLLVMLVAGGPYGAADVEGYLHRHLTDVLDLPAD